MFRRVGGEYWESHVRGEYWDGWWELDEPMDEQLEKAVEDGNIEWVQSLLDRGADVGGRARCGTLLNDAICSGARRSVEVLELLLDRGANLEAPDMESWTPLHIACQTSYSFGDNSVLIMVQLLLNRGANINATTTEGETALHLACMAGVAEILVDRGANIEATTNKGETALHRACDYGWSEIVEWLLDRGARIEATTNEGLTPLHCACMRRDLNVVQLLLDKGANKNARDDIGRTPLYHTVDTVRDGHEFVSHGLNEELFHCRASPVSVLDMVKELIKRDVDVTLAESSGLTPLHRAVTEGNIDVTWELLTNGAAALLTNGAL